MITERALFLSHVAQTSAFPLALEVGKARGSYIYTTQGQAYLDMISGISVSNIGHCHPNVVEAIQRQSELYMHTMVYGEHVQSPQVQLAKLLAENLPETLSTTYFVNSGSEAIEGALKLAKRYTQRTRIVSFKNAYHGSSHGALSVMGDERLKQPFRPLLPDIHFLRYNTEEDLQQINQQVAAVLVEPIQGEAGIVLPNKGYLKKLQQRCNEVGALLIMDEIQTGYGRTGSLFAFEQENVLPDILCLAKGMGGGLPIGAFISSPNIMSVLSHDPELGHITTFGGNPVCAAAALATLQTILSEKLIKASERKAKMIHETFSNHPHVLQFRQRGLFAALEFESFEKNIKIIQNCYNNGVLVDWFLFNLKSMRIAPPLTISEPELERGLEIISKGILTD